jgi:hypothetical protein
MFLDLMDLMEYGALDERERGRRTFALLILVRGVLSWCVCGFLPDER